MMHDKVKAILRAVILVPIFVVVVTAWVPFMILKDLWLKSAEEVNTLFENHL